MKRILMVVLAVTLALGLAVTAYAGELKLGGKEAGVNATYTGGVKTDCAMYIKVGSLDFVDGSFKFHVSDMKINYFPHTHAAGLSEVSVNMDYGKWYAETGGDGIVFTFSNDRGKWVPFLGFLKPAAKIKDDNPHRAVFLATGKGVIAGLNLNFNLYETENGRKDMSLAGSTTFGGAKLAGFYGDFDGTDYYGGDVTFADVLSDADLMAGIYANKNTPESGLAYRVDIAGLKAGSITLDANYQFGNANVLQSSSWKDGNVPAANKKEFFAKASLPLTFFDFSSTLTAEFTRFLTPGTNKFKITDKFDISSSVTAVTLVAELGSAVADNYSAAAAIAPGVDGLTIYPKVSKIVEGSPAPDLKFETEAEYKIDKTTLRGGFTYQGGLNRYYAYGDSKGTYGTLDTQVAGIYYKKDITATEKVYTRGYLSATTDLTEYLTGIGAKFLYLKNDTADAQTVAAIGGNYAVSADTTLTASYLFKNPGTAHFYLALTKKVGGATFALSYGANKNYKNANDGSVHKPGFKEWIKEDNVPWRELLGTEGAKQNQIRLAQTVPF